MPVIGDRIRAARLAMFLTQKELARQVGVDAISVSRWERGEHEPSLRTLQDVAVATGKSVAWFFADDGVAA